MSCGFGGQFPVADHGAVVSYLVTFMVSGGFKGPCVCPGRLFHPDRANVRGVVLVCRALHQTRISKVATHWARSD